MSKKPLKSLKRAKRKEMQRGRNESYTNKGIWSSLHSQYRAQAFPSSFSLLVLNVLLRGGLLSNPSLGVGFLPVHSIIVSHLDVGSSVGSPVHTCQRNAEAIRVAPRDVEGEDAAGLTESCGVERNLCCELFVLWKCLLGQCNPYLRTAVFVPH